MAPYDFIPGKVLFTPGKVKKFLGKKVVVPKSKFSSRLFHPLKRFFYLRKSDFIPGNVIPSPEKLILSPEKNVQPFKSCG